MDSITLELWLTASNGTEGATPSASGLRRWDGLSSIRFKNPWQS
jgi:hypothetical protein